MRRPDDPRDGVLPSACSELEPGVVFVTYLCCESCDEHIQTQANYEEADCGDLDDIVKKEFRYRLCLLELLHRFLSEL